MAHSQHEASPRPAAAPGTIDGPALERAFRGAAAALVRQADALNAINVFPVPDGDTGTNMSMTMRAAVDAITAADDTAGKVAAAVTRGALMGARGNSGVILSQILAGFSADDASVDARDHFDGPALAAAFEAANTAARRVISKPREGTILTAIAAAAEAAAEAANQHANPPPTQGGARGGSSAEAATEAANQDANPPPSQGGARGGSSAEAASAEAASTEAASQHLNSPPSQGGARGGSSAEAVLAAASEAAADAAARTPDMLPVLKEAGVVDAGAQGLAVALDGMLRALRGEALAEAADFGAIDEGWLAATARVHADGEASGFCTEFVLTAASAAEAIAAVDPDELRRYLRDAGDSVLVVGGADVLRVHVHTHQPNDVLAHARTLGTVSHEKVEDMEAQFQALAQRDRPSATPRAALAVVAVGAGPGIETLFESLGATVVRGGQTMNPSAGEIRDAIVATSAADVIVLPNNKNIILAARQAEAALADERAANAVHVLETRSVPQGIAALIAMNPDGSAAENIDAMNEAAAAVRTGEVTLAARATRLAGNAVTEGQPIGIVDDELVVAEATVPDAVRACVTRMIEGRTSPLITLYRGEGVDEVTAEELAASLREQHSTDVEIVDGGQPHYPYLIGVE